MKWLCITTLVLIVLSASNALNCYGPSTKLNLKEFDVFPSPVSPGEYIYARANLFPSSEINSAKVSISVYYSDSSDISNDQEPIIQMNGLDFCTLSTMVTCPLKTNSTILAWEYLVPSVPPGIYQVIYEIVEDNPADGNPYSCIQFPVNIAGIRSNTLSSHYQATLLGSALFSKPDYTKRTIDDPVQVGPAGPLGFASSPYGQIRLLKGTGDLVPNPYYDTSNFIWGMNGTIDSVATSAAGISQTYIGDCYLGYIGNGVTFDHNNPLLDCTFKMTWTYKNSDIAQISGTATFTPSATIPVGWGFPLLYGRLGTHQISTSDVGFLTISGDLTMCANGKICDSPPIHGGGGSGGLASDKLGLAIGLPLAALFVALIIGTAFFWLKRRRETEQEDGIFAVARKPEYGSALVVDDIIEESRGSKTLQAMLDVKDEYSENESDEESDRSGSDRGRSRTPASARSHSRSRSRSSSGERSHDDESDPGESADRGSDSE